MRIPASPHLPPTPMWMPSSPCSGCYTHHPPPYLLCALIPPIGLTLGGSPPHPHGALTPHPSCPPHVDTLQTLPAVWHLYRDSPLEGISFGRCPQCQTSSPGWEWSYAVGLIIWSTFENTSKPLITSITPRLLRKAYLCPALASSSWWAPPPTCSPTKLLHLPRGNFSHAFWYSLDCVSLFLFLVNIYSSFRIGPKHCLVLPFHTPSPVRCPYPFIHFTHICWVWSTYQSSC